MPYSGKTPMTFNLFTYIKNIGVVAGLLPCNTEMPRFAAEW